MMAKPPAKNTAFKPSTPDYFRLPFEVYYSEHIAVTMMELKSDIKVKKFEDIKTVHKEQGGSWGTSFLCALNKGPELYCCIHNLHDEVAPDWLKFLDEDNMEMNYGCDYAIVIEGKEIQFVELTDEQQDEDTDDFINVDNMEQCCSWTFFVYELGDSSPDYLILDAEDSRIKVSLEGFVLDDEGNLTGERIFDPDELDEDEFEEFTSKEMWEAKSDWIHSIIEADFPKQKAKLRLSLDTE
jgi:hypothetical protein